MNTFKRKALFTAVVAGLGVAGSAEAYMTPNRTGQILVYPYYTVPSAGGLNYSTYISVVNTTALAKTVKVRVLEGKAKDVLDFNLFLSPENVWVSAINVPAPGDPQLGVVQDSAVASGGLMGTLDLGRAREGHVDLSDHRYGTTSQT